MKQSLLFMTRGLILLLSLLLAGFNSRGSDDIKALFKTEVRATTRQLSIASEDIMGPTLCLLAVDKYLLISTHEMDYHIYAYDLENNEFAFTQYAKGRGRGEISSTIKLSSYKEGIMLIGDKKILKSDSLYENSDRENWNPQENPSRLDIHNFATVGNNVVVTGLFMDSDKQFAILDNELKLLNYVDDYPSVSGESDKRALSMGFQGKLMASEYGFAYTSNYGSIMKFFRVNDQGVQKEKEYHFSVPKFKFINLTGGFGVAPDRSNLLGSISVTASSDCYYILYSEDTMDKGSYESHIIYCFNKNGEPNQKIILDKAVESISYSKKMGKLYALGVDEYDPYFYEIVIPE